MYEVVVRVSPDASREEQEARVLEVLEGHGLTLADVGTRCSVVVQTRSPDRRIQRSLWSQLRGDTPRGGAYAGLRGVFRR